MFYVSTLFTLYLAFAYVNVVYVLVTQFYCVLFPPSVPSNCLYCRNLNVIYVVLNKLMKKTFFFVHDFCKSSSILYLYLLKEIINKLIN